MTSPRLIFNDFFRDPFGGEMKSIGGMGGDGVLENIQQQVADNGEALQALQGGIGGLPSGNLPLRGIGGNPADSHKKSQPGGGFNPGDIGLIPQEPPPMSEPPMSEPQDPILDFRSMVTDSYRREGIDDAFFESEFYLNTFDGGGMSGIFGGPEGQVAAMSKYFGMGGSNSGARDAAYENYLRATGQEDKIKTDHNYTDIGGIFNLNDITQPVTGVTQPVFERPGPVDPFRTPNLNTMEIGNVGGMDQLFGRAFAGKPI